MHARAHTSMDNTCMKEKMYKFFLLIQSRPCIMLILLLLVLSTLLRIIMPSFLVLCSIATLTCLALGTGDLLAFVPKTGDFPFGFNRSKRSSSSSSHTSMQGDDCNHVGLDAPRSSSTNWRCNFGQTLQRILLSSLDFVKRHVLADIDEEGLMVECAHSTRPSFRANVSKQEEGAKNDRNACVCEDCSAIDESMLCAHGVCMVGVDDEAHGCANLSHEDGEAGDVPELEDCSTSSEEEEVCKSVLETSAHASASLDDTAFGDTILQPTANGMKSTTSCEEDDENSIDKHQILPLEACKQCKTVNIKGFSAFASSNKCPCDTERSVHKLDVTDAELQDAASEFYTLEGDVLWTEADLKKKPDCKRPDKGSDVMPGICEICKHGMSPVSSENFSVLQSKTCMGTKKFAHKPVNAKVVYYVEAMRAHQENRSEGSMLPMLTKDMNEDVRIDQELRAIASRSGNKGEESNYMSTAGSFRDFVGSFREFDACWPEYDIMGRSEDDFVTGCCDDHARPCISHSRSRSKVLQSDPLLSKASLIREQEIMDVLWQEYNEDRRLRFNGFGELQKDNAHKQRLKVGTDSSSNTNEVLDEGTPADHMDVQAKEYVMKLNNVPENDIYDRNNVDQCRLGCDKPCWHMAKARSYQRRRHFVGFCRLFRDLGLKQCMQSSKVDN